MSLKYLFIPDMKSDFSFNRRYVFLHSAKKLFMLKDPFAIQIIKTKDVKTKVEFYFEVSF